jgi:hypothetical protein
MKINEYVAGEFLAATDFVDGEKATFADGGEEANFADGRKGITFKVSLKSGDVKKWTPNKTTLKALGSAWGMDTDDWEGKKVKLSKVKMSVRGKLMTVIMGEPEGGEEEEVDVEL